MNELIFDLRAEMVKISVIDVESIDCASHKVQDF